MVAIIKRHMQTQNPLTQIPQIEKLLSHAALAEYIDSIGRPIVGRIISEYIQAVRHAAKQGVPVPSFEECLTDIKKNCLLIKRKRITKVINATGIILHTNLGRSPLVQGVWDAVKSSIDSYAAIEMDLASGKRGKRFPFAVEAMNTLVGCESSVMLNNNAAAVFLLLKALASDKEVIVARGQQVQIGGGFRIPDILQAAGCRLIEVGTTNITTVRDVEQALSDRTAMVLWVHTSNYKIRGFTETPRISELKACLPPSVILAVDQGSGNSALDIPDEPSVSFLLKEGADLVCFSGDKILGGPQCGWVTGKKSLVDVIAQHPLMRTYRVGRAVAALMEETLVRYLNNGKSAARSALEADQNAVKARCEAFVSHVPHAQVVSYPFSLGGGSTPDAAFASWAVQLSVQDPESVKRALRFCAVPIIAFIEDGKLVVHLASVDPADDSYIVRQLQAIMEEGE
ncbi:MAG: L-seryl-tRNA(Sec) selenium transferase [Treponema sp.]